MAKSLEDRLGGLAALTSEEKKHKRSSKFSYINFDFVMEMLNAGLRLPQIAKVYACSPQTIRYRMRLEDPDFDARKHLRLGKWEITPEMVAVLYKRIKNCNKVADILGVNTHAVTERLDKLGITRRPLYRADVTEEKVARLYEEYKSTTRVATELHTTTAVIRDRLESAGIKIDYGWRKILPRRTDLPENYILRLYDANKSIAYIARKCCAAHGTIRRILVENNREIRER